LANRAVAEVLAADKDHVIQLFQLDGAVHAEIGTWSRRQRTGSVSV
jgi:hypothetical protein